jgi:hypothetical protein
MTSKPSTTAATTTAAATNRMQALNPEQQTALQKRDLLAEIGGKWGKFSEQDLSNLKDSDDLTAQVAAKYGLENRVANRDVAAFLNGRTF